MAAQSYYRRGLSGPRLRRGYELAPPRVQQYLEAEIAHLQGRVQGAAAVLELGCGYGRVLARLAEVAPWVVGIDTSIESLRLARDSTQAHGACDLLAMDATALGFRDRSFDAVVCIQNGIGAFRVEPRRLLGEALRVTRPGGRVLFSTYAAAFWPHRLRWFELQAAAGLVGEIDAEATHPGEIVCRDGFRSGTFTAGDFERLCGELGVEPAIAAVDGSSLFCEITRAGLAYSRRE
jgi:2-polyprenyl-6-hydroxyphenyl methylase/3-demethylubiquinone-9 3-methyltransferase